MAKFLYVGLATIFVCMVIIMACASALVLIHQCNPLANACDQNVIIGIYITITVASIAISAAAIIELALYSRQTKQNDKHHEEQMDAIKRLEGKIDKILGDQG